MQLSFTERNELLEIRIGDTVFATGGGNLWTAEFQATGAQATATCTVSASQAADFSRDEDDARIRLVWRGVPLGDGTVDAPAVHERW